jgi:hypothetical protein
VVTSSFVICIDGSGAIYFVEWQPGSKDAEAHHEVPAPIDAKQASHVHLKGIGGMPAGTSGQYQLGPQVVQQHGMIHTGAHEAEPIGQVLDALSAQVPISRAVTQNVHDDVMVVNTTSLQEVVQACLLPHWKESK